MQQHMAGDLNCYTQHVNSEMHINGISGYIILVKSKHSTK